MRKLGSVIAWILIVYGVVRTSLGFWVAFSFSDEENVAAANGYLAASNSGEAINEGMMIFAVGSVIGILVRIGILIKTADKNTFAK